MWWRKDRRQNRRLPRLLVALALAGVTAGCWQPLYGSHPGSESVPQKFAQVDIPPVVAPQGTPVQRIAIGVHNALEFDLHGGPGTPQAAAYRLVVNLGSTQWTVTIDKISGRPTAQIDSVVANYRLVEIATGKTVVTDNTFAHVDYDVPGSEQRFASQRARRDAEDRAVQVVAETIRTRLASYFVAGT